MTQMKRAVAAATFKSLDDPGTGTASGRVRALVSVFGNVDLGGDKMIPGAFTDTLKAWDESGDPIPFIWSHQWDNPDAHIGVVTAARETDAGLEVDAQLDMDRPFAAQVHHLLMNRRVTQFSFGYAAKDWAWAAADDTTPDTTVEVRELRAVDLFECGPTLLGMNPATQLLEAASATPLLDDAAPAPTSTSDGEASAACDGGGTINSARLADLLTMTRHRGE